MIKSGEKKLASLMLILHHLRRSSLAKARAIVIG